MSRSQFYAVLALVFVLVSFTYAPAQDDKKVLGEVTVHAEDPLYVGLRNLSSAADAFSGDYAVVSNVSFKKDRAVFTLKSGEIYFLKPADGRVTGAVFIGSGEFELTPPGQTEANSLGIFTGSGSVKESFDGLTMFFTDDTVQAIKALPNASIKQGGPQAEKARAEFRDKEKLLREQFHYNIDSRMLADIYAPSRPGFFTAFIAGQKFGKLLYGIDPMGHAEVYPEQVMLMSYGDTDGGVWTAFHQEAEYAKGTATSWTDRRSYDIKHHKIDCTLTGAKLSVTDEITIEMREANARFLPFDLFRSLRVQSVLDDAGSAVNFIQEKKEQDADFGIILPAPREPGKPFTLKVTYEGTEALREAGSGNFILLPRSTWYPNNPGTSFGDRATFDLTFHYPKKYMLVGTGERVGEEKLDKDIKTSQWSSGDVELAVAGFNYGDFKMKQFADPDTGLTLEVYTNKTLPTEMQNVQNAVDRADNMSEASAMGSLDTNTGAAVVMNDAQNSTRIYNAFFGKLPYKRISMTQQPAGFFGQAWPELVFMPYTAFFDSTQRVKLFGMQGAANGFWREVAAHEVAHQWWGHSVGWTSYHDQWMSEGFAEFSTSLFILYVKKDVNSFISFWENQRKLITEATPATRDRKPYTVGPVTQGYRLNTGKTGSIARVMIYPKGAFILHMLRMMMYDHKGTKDERFQKMMQDLIASNFNKDISTNDFKLAVEKHMTPAMDVDKNGKMDWFFDEWVYGTEMPSYKLTYSFRQGDGGKAIMDANIEQSGVSKDFVMSVPLYLDFGKGPLYLGSASIVGNSSVDINNIPLPSMPKSASVAALQDVLAAKIENVKK